MNNKTLKKAVSGKSLYFEYKYEAYFVVVFQIDAFLAIVGLTGCNQTVDCEMINNVW